MTTQRVANVISRTDRFEIGHLFEGAEGRSPTFLTEYCRFIGDVWFSDSPQTILSRLGVNVDRKRAQEVADLIDGDINGWYYVASAVEGVGEEAIKWIMGGLAAALNERALPFSQASRVLPPDYLNAFVKSLAANEFERSFAKDVFAELIASPRYATVFETDCVFERPGDGKPTFKGTSLSVRSVLDRVDAGESIESILGETKLTLDQLIHGQAFLFARDEMGWTSRRYIDGPDAVRIVASQPKYRPISASEIDDIIQLVVSDNPEQAAKVPGQPKLVQWFVGQVMKQAKGKAPAPIVLEKLKAHFGVD